MRYHKIDAWRGYKIPDLAVAGSSDTGSWSDSPCPTSEVLAEVRRFRKEVLKPAGIKARLRWGPSTNACMVKRWLVVSREDWDRAVEVVKAWAASSQYQDYSYVHDADLENL